MKIEFDPAKDRANKSKHSLSLALAKDMNIQAVIEDDRIDYGERRYRAFGTIDGMWCCLVFAVRGEVIRAISLRRAHLKELRRYVRQKDN